MIIKKYYGYRPYEAIVQISFENKITKIICSNQMFDILNYEIFKFCWRGIDDTGAPWLGLFLKDRLVKISPSNLLEGQSMDCYVTNYNGIDSIIRIKTNLF